jgi:hypothetical protein
VPGTHSPFSPESVLLILGGGYQGVSGGGVSGCARNGEFSSD